MRTFLCINEYLFPYNNTNNTKGTYASKFGSRYQEITVSNLEHKIFCHGSW